MALTSMYAGKINSPAAELTIAATSTDISVTVSDLSAFPTDPNLAVLGAGNAAETILYSTMSAAIGVGTLGGITRAFQGTASAWPLGTIISRRHTAYDYNTLRSGVIELQEKPLVLFPIGAIIPETAPATVDTTEMSNGINYVYGEYSSSYMLQWMHTLPAEFAGETFTFSVECLTTSLNGNTVIWNLNGLRVGNGVTRNSTMPLLDSVTVTNTGIEETIVSSESSAFLITGTGNTIHFELYRDYAVDTLVEPARVLAVRLTPVV